MAKVLSVSEIVNLLYGFTTFGTRVAGEPGIVPEIGARGYGGARRTCKSAASRPVFGLRQPGRHQQILVVVHEGLLEGTIEPFDLRLHFRGARIGPSVGDTAFVKVLLEVLETFT